MYKINKTTIEQNYKADIINYKTAHNQEERDEIAKSLARWERTAGELYGFEYLDELTKLKKGL